MMGSFNYLIFFVKGFCIMFLFFFGFHIIIANIIKSKDSICDVEKQSKFILECLNSNEKKGLQFCERIATRLYCK
jgi:hypothetical protein